MMKQIIIIGIFFFNVIFVRSQQLRPTLVNAGTISPEVASLGKFGNIPVSYVTGTPNISIPLFEIRNEKISVPISLDYHTSGIKVDEISSSVGIGWALSCGDIITRNLAGLADESSGGYLSQPDPITVSQNPSNYWEYLYNVLASQADAQPDIFTYSIHGNQGKFLFNKNGTIFQVPLTNNKIETYYANINGGPTGLCFKITDEDGLQYFYQQAEVYSFGSVNNVIRPAYRNVWHLTKIIAQNNTDEITFNYTSVCGNLSGDHIHSSSYLVGTSVVCSESGYGNKVDAPGGQQENLQDNNYTPFFISSINWKGGKIAFQYVCDRLDKSTEPRLSEVDVYSNINASYELVKKINLFQSYFFYRSTNLYSDNDERNYRLRLDKIGFSPVGNSNEQPLFYTFGYNTTQMASRETYALDQFGFCNGKWSNGSLIPLQLVKKGVNSAGIYVPGYLYIGNGSREPDANYMNACTLNSVQYPTGGKTVYALEPHQFIKSTTTVTTTNKSCPSDEGYQSSNTVTFTMPSNTTNVRSRVNISSFNYPEISDYPRAILTDQTNNNSEVFRVTNVHADETISQDWSELTLIPGHTYVMTSNIYSSSGQGVHMNRVFVHFEIEWEETSNVSSIGIGGGLRIQSITNYDVNGTFLNKKIYKYGSAEDGIGKLLTPYNYLSLTSQNVTYRIGCSNIGAGIVCTYTNSYQSTIYNSGSILPISQFAGSPVLYSSVSEYEVDHLSQFTNGRKVYSYLVSEDYQAIPGPDVFNQNYVLYPTSWKNGILTSERIYKTMPDNSFKLKDETIYNYSEKRTASLAALQVTGKYAELGGCNSHNASWVNNDILTSLYSIKTGVELLDNITHTYYDDNQNSISTVQSFVYDDPTHLFATGKQSSNSKSQVLSEVLSYPNSFSSSGGIYTKLLNRHIISPLIQDQLKLDGIQLSKTTVNYFDFFNNGNILLPNSIDVQSRNNPFETKIQFDSYDIYGNILGQRKANDKFESYIWGYNKSQIISKVDNALPSDMAYTSFEEEGKGNWNNYTGTITTAITDETMPPTGKKYYNLTTTNTLSTSVVNGKKYIVSYWSKDGAYNILGATSNSKMGRSYNGWTYYEHSVTTSSTVLTISGIGSIDEVRLYPADAQMTTYTYDPLIGMTSECDLNNRITYYEYDKLGRLAFIRNLDGKVIKKYEYAYQSANPDNVVPCSTGNCDGVGEKCINGFCERAKRYSTSVVRIQSGPDAGKWKCSYYYRWTDNTTLPADADSNNGRIEEISGLPCDIVQP